MAIIDGNGAAASAGPKVRCILAMLGVDVHSRGLRTLAGALEARGIEVIYLGEHNTAEAVAAAIKAEKADAVGLSFSNSTYREQMTNFFEVTRAAGVDQVPVLVGGLIHPDDESALREIGVAGVFGPGSSFDDIVEFLRGTAK